MPFEALVKLFASKVETAFVLGGFLKLLPVVWKVNVEPAEIAEVRPSILSTSFWVEISSTVESAAS